MAVVENRHYENERERLIEGIKASAMTIYKDAEKIIGDDPFLMSVSIEISAKSAELVTIRVERSKLPAPEFWDMTAPLQN